MKKAKTGASWKPGQSGNPKGRKPILLPEVQAAIDQNKNAVRIAILRLYNLSEIEFQEFQVKTLTMIERSICQCIERINTDGDVIKLKALLEIAIGKLPEDKKSDELTADEQALLDAYRKRLSEQNDKEAIEYSRDTDSGSAQ